MSFGGNKQFQPDAAACVAGISNCDEDKSTGADSHSGAVNISHAH